jgi:hypothetical protein
MTPAAAAAISSHVERVNFGNFGGLEMPLDRAQLTREGD